MNVQQTKTFLENATTAWQIRVMMAINGWSSEVSIDNRGISDGHHFSASFKRWDWHGRKVDKVVIEDSILSKNVDIDAISDHDMIESLRKAALKASEAWNDFPTSVPIQTYDGKILVNREETDHAFNSAISLGFISTPLPEDLPHNPMWLCDLDGFDGDPTIAPLRRLVKLGVHYADSLSSLHSTNQRWAKIKTWKFSIETLPRVWHGVKVAHCRRKMDAYELAESSISGVIDGLVNSYERLSVMYYPGGPRGPLPPGWFTIPEIIVRQEHDCRRRDIAQMGITNKDEINDEQIDKLLSIWLERHENLSFSKEYFTKPTSDIVRDAIKIADVSLAEIPTMRSWDVGDFEPAWDQRRGPRPLYVFRRPEKTKEIDVLTSLSEGDSTPVVNLRDVNVLENEDLPEEKGRMEVERRLEILKSLQDTSFDNLHERLLRPSSYLGMPDFVPPVRIAAVSLIGILESGKPAPKGTADLIRSLSGMVFVGPTNRDGYPALGLNIYETNELHLEAAARICQLVPDIAERMGVGAGLASSLKR